MLKLWLTLPVLLSACLKDETVSGYAEPDLVFALQQWNGRSYSATATIAFPEAGRISGEGPCNQYFAKLTVPYPWFAITDIGATRRACPDLQAEQDYFRALREASLAIVSGPVLTLSNDAGLEMVFLADQE